MSLQALLDRLEIPIIQAPMVGASDGALAIAVSHAGGLGTLAAGTLAPADIGPAVDAVRAASGAAPFGVNLLMAPKASPDAAAVDAALARLSPWYAALGETPPAAPNQFAPDFEAQLEALIAAAPPIASFTFDVLSKAQVEALQSAGTYVVGTATTVAEARAWADAGADGICVQGAEAGGHRGHFLREVEDSLVGTIALVSTVRQAVDLPVIAAGGIMDGRGVAAALALGAAAAQMGTAFLLADEAVTSKPWRDAVAGAPDDPTRLTRAFTGRHARGIENRFMRELRDVEVEVPAYPVQNRLTQPLRAAAAKADQPDMISLWAGQAVRMAKQGGAESLVRTWWDEAKAAARELSSRAGV
jgi:nitronate monooxygenase